jgi:DNA-binding transcriptional ArsR family regulator
MKRALVLTTAPDATRNPLQARDPALGDRAEQLLFELLDETNALPDILRALGSPQRLDVIKELLRWDVDKHSLPMSFTDLKKHCSKVPGNRLPYHLRVLQEAGLVYRLGKLSVTDARAENDFRSFYQLSTLTGVLLKGLLRALSTGDAA